MNDALSQSWGRALALAAVAALVLALLPIATAFATHGSGETARVAGDNRYDTAAQLATDAFPEGATTVILASGEDFPDALAAAALAGDRDAPVLLTRRETLPTETRAALDELGPVSVIILGGTAAVDESVETTLAEDFEVERIGGEDRFETARLAAEAIVGGFGTMPSEDEQQEGPLPGEPLTTAVLATGFNFPDALAVGPLSFAGVHPVLLTRVDTLPADTQAVLEDEALGVEQVVILGGTEAISASVEQTVADDLQLEVIRVAGADRTETAVRVAELTAAANENFAFTGEQDALSITNGRNFPDALALAPHAAGRASTIVLANTPDDIGTTTATFVDDHCAGFGNVDDPVVIAGGTEAVTGTTEAAIRVAAICEDFVPAGGLTLDPPETAETQAGGTFELSITGVNALDEPAEGAEVLVQVFRESSLTEPPDDQRFYQEDATIFVHTANSEIVTLDAAGTATSDYTHDAAREDRVVVCTPPEPNLEEGGSCTDATGQIPEDVKWDTRVIAHTWAG